MSSVKPITYLILAGSLLVAGRYGLAQHHGHAASSRSELSALDKDYLKDTAQSNLEEIQFAPTVQRQAGNSADRQFGQHMKSAHARANAQLKALASRVGYALPKDVSEEQHAIMERLGKLKGAKFDAAYKQEMIRDHTADIAETQREISLGRNPLVKANAQKKPSAAAEALENVQIFTGGWFAGQQPPYVGRGIKSVERSAGLFKV